MGTKTDHTNMLTSGLDKREVYQKFQQDLRRDGRQFRALTTAGAIVLIISWTKGIPDGWPWFLVGFCIFMQALIIFVEMSNRNFMMHVLDWLEHQAGSTGTH